MATPAGVQGQLLDITVVGCNNLRDTEWISRQDPYVVLEYATSKFRTSTHTDGGKNPKFNTKFTISLIEGLREVEVSVWNYNTMSSDDLIGTGKIQLSRVLAQGYDDTTWSLLGKKGRHGGEVRVIMHYANPQYGMAVQHHTAPAYSAPPQAQYHTHAPPASFPPVGHQPPTYPSQPPISASFAPGASAHHHHPSAAPYHHAQQYPPQTYPPQTYPPQTYPPQTYPPSSGASLPNSLPSLVPYGGTYPPPPPPY